jgi:ACT domain-containing protein
MFALVFLSVGLLAIAQLIPIAGAQLTSSRNYTSSQEAAQTVLDDLGSLDYTDAQLVAGSHTIIDGARTIVYTIQDNVPLTGTKRVDLTVSWQESGGTQTVTYTTLISR